MSPEPVTAEALRSLLIRDLGAVARRSWGFDALYRDGRLFVMFDGDELIGKWPPSTRERLHGSVSGVRAFREQDDVRDAEWLRVPLASLSVEEAVSLATEAADFVRTPEGGPKHRRVRRHAR